MQTCNYCGDTLEHAEYAINMASLPEIKGFVVCQTCHDLIRGRLEAETKERI